MIIRNTLITASAFAGLAAPAAFGFAEIARGTLTADVSFRTEYDSNIFGNSSEQDDFSAIVAPSLSYNRDAGQISASVHLGFNAIAFEDADDENSINPTLSANLRWDRADKGSVSQSLSYARTNGASSTLNDRVESDEYRGATRVDYFYSEKTGLRFNVGYRMSDYTSSGYNDVWSYNVGGGVIYRYSPKLLASATYDFSPEKATNLNGASDPSSKNHRFQLGLEGALSPKLSGSIGAGLAHRDFDEGGSTNAFLLSAALSWAAAEKTNVTLSASNDFDTTGDADSAEVFAFALSVSQAITEKFTTSASISYQHIQLEKRPIVIDRTDDVYIAGLNAVYSFNDKVSASGSLSYRINESTLALADYDRFVANFGLNLHF